MGKIQMLTDEVIGKIAAGEVVERPAAAIKELVENSLDAGASAVTVEIRDGGISYFRVTDNGFGIQQSEIRMAFERHATSKITKSQDLHAIATLGFRGEALASIAAVARVTCTTRTKDDPSGLKVVNEGGRITSIEEAACPQGTTFVVRDLFFNTPVRLKFLKKPTTEAGLVSDLMMRLILSRPDVSFRYVSNGKTLYHSAGDGKMESAVFSIYGNEMLRAMRKVDGHQSGMVLKGFVGIGESGRSNRSHQSFFINGRYMKSGILSAGVEAACRERVMIGKYPTCVLHLTMPYDLVDVNVHPNKLEVRFQNEAAIAQAVEDIVRDALTDRDALEHPVQLLLTKEDAPKTPVTVSRVQETRKQVAADTSEESKTFFERTNASAEARVIPKAPIAIAVEKSSASNRLLDCKTAGSSMMLRNDTDILNGFRPQDGCESQKETKVEINSKQTSVSSFATQTEQVASFLPEAPTPLKMIGTLFDTYILVEYQDHLLMIDQHAVHERLLFDRLMKAYDQQQCGQELLIPMVVTVTRTEQQLIEEHRELLEKMGLTVESFGEQEVSIRTIPMILGQPQTQTFLHEVLDQLGSERGSYSMEKRRAAILQTACKHAVKGGEKLSMDVLRDLVRRMIDEKVTPTCPHGRPLVVALSHTELDKRFKRIQN